jgi:hypothetical protein
LKEVLDFKMDHFSNLPNEMIAKVFHYLLADTNIRFTNYSRLHLVCRRWHLVCVDWAEHLPKCEQRFQLRFGYDGCYCTVWLDSGSHKLIRNPYCVNYDGSGVGAKLTDLLRHFKKSPLFWLVFAGDFWTDKFFVCTDSLLLQLIKLQLTNMNRLEFRRCDMRGVTEDVLITFLAAVAESKTCSRLEIIDLKSGEVISDRAVAPMRATEYFFMVVKKLSDPWP